VTPRFRLLPMSVDVTAVQLQVWSAFAILQLLEATQLEFGIPSTTVAADDKPQCNRRFEPSTPSSRVRSTPQLCHSRVSPLPSDHCQPAPDAQLAPCRALSTRDPVRFDSSESFEVGPRYRPRGGQGDLECPRSILSAARYGFHIDSALGQITKELQTNTMCRFKELEGEAARVSQIRRAFNSVQQKQSKIASPLKAAHLADGIQLPIHSTITGSRVDLMLKGV
jgi:hypothetical protein